MRLIDIQCLDCNKVSEVLLKSSEEKPKCPECGSENVKRKYSALPIHFKTSGFYTTDYKGK